MSCTSGNIKTHPSNPMIMEPMESLQITNLGLSCRMHMKDHIIQHSGYVGPR